MKKSIFLTTLIALATGLAAEAYAATAKITLMAEAQVQPGSIVTVKDIAGVQATKEVAELIGDVMVTRAPLAGQSRTMDASSIKQKICFAAPKASISTLGSSTVKISGACTKVTAQELTDAAREFALGRLPKTNCEYEVTVDQITRDIIAPADVDVRIEAELVADALHTGLNPMRLNVKAGDKVAGTTYASVRVKATASVLVATDVIEMGALLTSQNTTWETRDVTKSPNAILEGASLDVVAKKTIQPGSMIARTDVATPLAIKRGETISLVVKCGKVVLQTAAEAKQDGSVGDTIRVLSPVSSGEVKAKIVEPGLAEIRM